MPSAPPLAVITASDRWLLGFSVAALLVVTGAVAVRRGARVARKGSQRRDSGPRGIRRRAGALVALGPAVGLAFAPEFDVAMLTAVLGALALAAFGLLTERDAAPQRATLVAVSLAAVAAVAAGPRFGPT